MNWKKLKDKRRNYIDTKKKSKIYHNSQQVKIEELNDRISVLEHKEILIDSLLHELRSINGDLKDCLDAINFDNNKTVIPVWAQANLLSIRMQMYDFEINPNLFLQSEKYKIPIYKRIEKVYKCLDNLHFRKNVSIKLNGNTWLSFYSIDIIEIAFYIIIHNAIKYAPAQSDVNITFYEIGDNIKVVFSNTGFLPDKEEIEKLTERGYRGSNARNGKTVGSGIGLFTMSKICKELDIEYRIDTIIQSPSTNYGLFNVTLIFRNCI